MARERIEDVVARLATPVAEQLGYELVDVEYVKEGPDWFLRCTIDNLTGISTIDCQRFSEALDKIIDAEDPIPGSYLLEVSSPGIDRPLKKEHDFIRFAGQRVELKLHQAVDGKKIYCGELIGLVNNDNNNLSEQSIQIKIDDTTIREIPRKDVSKAHLVWEDFGQKGGKRKK